MEKDKIQLRKNSPFISSLLKTQRKETLNAKIQSHYDFKIEALNQKSNTNVRLNYF